MEKWLLSILFGLLGGFNVAAAQSCQFRLDMFDSFGDGWNGGRLLVSHGGSIQEFSLLNVSGSGSDSTVYFTVQAGMPLILLWSSGLFDEEISFVLYDNEDGVVFSASNPKSGLLFILPKVQCYTCLRPLNLKVENIWDTRARLAWTTASGGQAPVGWRVTYGPAGFDPSAGGTVASTALPRITLTGLAPNTEYDCYVQQECDNDSISRLAGPLRFRTYRTHDVGISAIVAPQSGCSLGVEAVTVVLRNYGAAPQTLIPFNFSINGTLASVPQPSDGFFTGILGKDSAAMVAFETLYDFSAPGEYLIEAWTEMKDDEYRQNDTVRLRVLNRLRPPYFQDFEDWAGGWTVDTAASSLPSWAWGVPAGEAIAKAGSGKNAWVTNLSGTYNNFELSYLQSPCFDFSGLTRDPVIEFLLYYDIEQGYDGAWLEVSADNGTTWSRVGQLGADIHWYNEIIPAPFLDTAWSGQSKGWLFARHPLTGTAGKAEVRLRFAFRADPFLSLEGIGVDAVRIYEPVANDLAALSVRTAGEADACGLADDAVVLYLANLGFQPVTAYSVAYALPGKPAVVENAGPVSLGPNTAAFYTFSQTFDSRDANLTLRAWVQLSGDTRSTNDSTEHRVEHQPLSLPLREGFESGLPPGWTTTGEVTDGHNNTSKVLSQNLFALSPFFELITSRYGFVQVGDSLAFDYRITDYNSNGTVGTALAPGTYFEVLVSDNCGTSYKTLYIIDASNHVPSAAMRQVRLDMSAYAGRSVILRVEGVWSAGDFYFDIDNLQLPALKTISAPEHPASEPWAFTLWPNPTSGLVYLQGQGESVAEARIQVVDATGRVWWERQMSHIEQVAETLNLQAAPAGVYWVRVSTDTFQATRKIIKH